MRPYVGLELELFQRALRWKAYFGALIRPFLGRDVLEVGAGLGATTRALCGESQSRWVCLKPEAEMAGALREPATAPPCQRAVKSSRE